MYRTGDLRVTEYGSSVYDARGDYTDLPVGVAYLPHSCDCWVIGGPEQIRALIADLTKLLEDK